MRRGGRRSRVTDERRRGSMKRGTGIEDRRRKVARRRERERKKEAKGGGRGLSILLPPAAKLRIDVSRLELLFLRLKRYQ